MKEMINNHIGISQKIETFAEFSTKVMHSVATTLYFLQVNKYVKDLWKESETTYSI